MTDTPGLDPELLAAAEDWVRQDPTTATARPWRPRSPRPRPGTCWRPPTLTSRFAGTLAFGTAGLRGELGPRPGPDEPRRSCGAPRPGWRATCSDAARGRATPLRRRRRLRRPPQLGRFALDSAAVFAAAGLEAVLLPAPAAHPCARLRRPAPRCRRRRHGHREPQPAGRQRLQGLPRRWMTEAGGTDHPPSDAEIAGFIDARRRLGSIPLADEGWTVLDEEHRGVVPARRRAVRATPAIRHLPPGAWTSCTRTLHGVGGAVFPDLFEDAVSTGRTWCPSRPTRIPRSRRSPSPTPRSRVPWTWRSRRPGNAARTSCRQRPRRRPAGPGGPVRAREGGEADRRAGLAHASPVTRSGRCSGHHLITQLHDRGRGGQPVVSSRLLSRLAAELGVTHDEPR